MNQNICSKQLRNANRAGIRALLFGVLLATFSSCLHRGYLQFTPKPDELVASDVVRAFIKQNPNASIVLRVPQPAEGATRSDPNSSIYNSIEKELILAGFNLKDRGLFNQVVNSPVALDYSKIADLTGTDLILELVSADRKIPITTNRAYTKDGEEKVLEDVSYTRHGAAIEFRIILVRTNAYGGSFSFYDSPCTAPNDDCYCKVGYKFGGTKFYPDHVVHFCAIDSVQLNVKNPAFESYPVDDFERFVRSGVKELIGIIRQ